ncbi:type II toxin-antitoxin system RelE/ParE family toxin [Halomonas halmophila]|uniref:Translation repressor RelE n=1 Tax=Halomonas halmophila TaxID=252 RepID=A0A4Y4F3Y7_9GAMM|nr:type II toxin-antitoxin system RelE/ParE family toxin [Halomonas halmophila]GED22320.1 hypothetical protein HHA01_12970 [Halomonas halmophila]
MKVVWTPEAEADRFDILEYIADDNPIAAVHMDRLFSDAAAALEHFPMQGRPGTILGTRELIPHENYRLVYELADDRVWVLALMHTARQWPPVPPSQE